MNRTCTFFLYSRSCVVFFRHLGTGTCTPGVGPIAPVHIRAHRVGPTPAITVFVTVGLETRVAPPPTRPTAVFPTVAFSPTPTPTKTATCSSCPLHSCLA